jgi:carbonic anhydrase/acetyltransferase-like protein (isoleucine patch superfamily)/8-oxo-dGTP pyrophosphatase MutT (NUDIX family)
MAVDASEFLAWVEAFPGVWAFERQLNPNDQTPEQLRDLHTRLSVATRAVPRFIHPGARVHQTAILEGNVAVDDGAQILPYAIVQGPAYIGRRAVVGNFSVLRTDCFLSRDSLVGNHCYCNEAVLGPSARIAHYVNFSRSFVGYNSAISAFVLTATTRADKSAITSNSQAMTAEKLGVTIGTGTFIAPHVTLQPGISIGSRSFVGSFTMIDHDIGSDTFVRVRQNLEKTSRSLAIPIRKKVKQFGRRFDQATDRRYAGVLLLDGAGHYILQRRDMQAETRNAGRLSAFGGRLEPREDAIDAAVRELYEETELRVAGGDLEPLVQATIQREDGSTTDCAMFVLDGVDPAQVHVREGDGYELVPVGGASANRDLTDLCRIAIAAYSQH